MPMTKEEFVEGFRDLADDFTNPNSELSSILEELEGEDFRAIRTFDPELSRLFDRFGDAIRDLRTYVLAKTESIGSTEKI